MKIPLNILKFYLLSIILVIFLLTKICLSQKDNNSDDDNEDDDDDNVVGISISAAKGRPLLKLNLTSEDTIMKLPARQKEQLVKKGEGRKFSPFRVTPGDTMCAFEKYRYFFNQARKLNIKPVDLLMTAYIAFNETADMYFYDPKDLCIDIEEEFILDLYQFDCSRAGICVCGLYYSYVDPNLPQPDAVNGVRTYLGTVGLDRKLIVEESLCVSGFMGHCTLPESKAVEKLDCSSHMECVLDESYGPLLTNRVTKEVYGICAYKQPDAPPGENFTPEDYRRMIEEEGK